MDQEKFQYLGRYVQDAAKTTISRRSARTPPKEHTRRNPRSGIEQREQYITRQDKDTYNLELDMVRTIAFNFHSVRSVLIAKLRTKTSQNIRELDYKIDTGSYGNLMPIDMFNMLFPRTQ